MAEALMLGSLSGLNLLTSCTSNDGTANYSYDPTGQLISATYSSPLPLGEGQGEGLSDESYTYDLNGNRVTANGYVYTTGADNRLLSDGAYWYAYDAEGNQTARFIDVDGSQSLTIGDTDVTTYGWDYRNRLVRIENYDVEGGSLDQAVDYLYDVENRWIGEDIWSPLPPGEGQGEGGGWTNHQIRFAYDGNQIVLQFEGAGDSGLGASDLSHRYLWQPDAVDQLMADEQLSPLPLGEGQGEGEGYDVTTPGQVVWPLGDNLGTIRDLAVAENGITSVVNHRVYDSYGNLKSQAAVDCLFGFTGRPFDKVTGIQDNGQRKYDALTGRWMSKDPIGYYGGDANQYRYVGNNSVMYVDPSGLDRRIVTWFGHLILEVQLPGGKSVFLEFNPRGYVKTEPYFWLGAIPMSDWIPSTPEQDAKLIKLWEKLEQKRDWTTSWNPVNNCWVPVVNYAGYGLDYPPKSFPPGWDPYEHACWNCHAPEVKAWMKATDEQRKHWKWPLK